jgi:Protein of unknown function (DUF3987)
MTHPTPNDPVEVRWAYLNRELRARGYDQRQIDEIDETDAWRVIGTTPLKANGDARSSHAPKAPASAVGGIPFVFTADMKRRLRAMEYTDAQIADMRPADAHEILNSSVGIAVPPQPQRSQARDDANPSDRQAALQSNDDAAELQFDDDVYELPIDDPAAARIAAAAFTTMRLGNGDKLKAIEAASRQLDPITQADALDFLSDVAIDNFRLDPEAVQEALARGQDLREKDREAGRPRVASSPSKQWQNPKPLPTTLLSVKPFDYTLLPANIAPWVEDISERMQCPPDFVAIPAMVALGAVLGRRIGIRPQRRTDWIEVPNLWGGIIGRPGVLKSPAMAEALKPLHRLEADARKANAEARESYAAELKAFKIKADAARSAVKKAVANGEAAAITSIEEPEEPKDRRYVANDCTYEALGQILVDNPNGVLTFRDELVSLLKTLDREEYVAARGFFLTAWNGTTGYTFDRIIRGHTHIDAACVSLLGSTQPAKIAEYVRRAVSGDGDDGLIARFGLLVWPDGSPEWKDVDRFPDTAARQTAWQTFERLDKLSPDAVSATKDPFEPIPFLRFDEEAQEIFNEWRQSFEPRLRAGDLHPALESHFAKYRKLVPSLALISALADGVTGTVDGPACLRALTFAQYLESHARRIYAAGKESEVSAAKAIVSRIRKGDLVDGFTCREIHQHGWSNLSNAEQVKAGLDLLADCDWLSENSVKTAGRPKTTYLINPKVHQ